MACTTDCNSESSKYVGGENGAGLKDEQLLIVHVCLALIVSFERGLGMH